MTRKELISAAIIFGYYVSALWHGFEPCFEIMPLLIVIIVYNVIGVLLICGTERNFCGTFRSVPHTIMRNDYAVF